MDEFAKPLIDKQLLVQVHGKGTYVQSDKISILGVLLSPLAFITGVPWEEAVQAGSYIGEKFTLNEFVAFSSFSEDISNLSDKTTVIVTFALCGFANLGAMGMVIGGMGGLAPSRKAVFSRFAFFAVIGGTLANLLSAAVAGMVV